MSQASAVIGDSLQRALVRSRTALAVTAIDEADMAIAASSGVTSPAIASGTNTQIVADGDGEVLQRHAARGAGHGQRLEHRRQPLALEHGVGRRLADVGRGRRRQRGVARRPAPAHR